MKQITILRHAKSSWALPGVTDHQRPLNDRGRKQTELLVDWFSVQDPKPDLVLCSSSLRTRETYDGIAAALGEARLEIVDKLYEGYIDDYLEVLFGQHSNNILIIGHNPTCDELVRYLGKPSGPVAQKLMAHHFGTANLAVLNYPGDDWSKLAEASCELVDFVRPADLSDE